MKTRRRRTRAFFLDRVVALLPVSFAASMYIVQSPEEATCKKEEESSRVL